MIVLLMRYAVAGVGLWSFFDKVRQSLDPLGLAITHILVIAGILALLGFLRFQRDIGRDLASIPPEDGLDYSSLEAYDRSIRDMFDKKAGHKPERPTNSP